MKYFLTILLTAIVFKSYSQANVTPLVMVAFKNHLAYYGKLLKEDGNTVKVEFFNSHSIYQFDKTGKILSSTGKYKAGDFVLAIEINRFEKEVYSQGYVSSNKLAGIVFNDGQLYYGNIEDASSGWFYVRFLHSNSAYTMQFTDATWKVKSTDKGGYTPGSVLKSIFYTGESEAFYFEGVGSPSKQKFQFNKDNN